MEKFPVESLYFATSQIHVYNNNFAAYFFCNIHGLCKPEADYFKKVGILRKYFNVSGNKLTLGFRHNFRVL